MFVCFFSTTTSLVFTTYVHNTYKEGAIFRPERKCQIKLDLNLCFVTVT